MIARYDAYRRIHRTTGPVDDEPSVSSVVVSLAGGAAAGTVTATCAGVVDWVVSVGAITVMPTRPVTA